MGTISDLVSFSLLQPLQGARTKPLAPIYFPKVISDDSDASVQQGQQLGTGIGKAIKGSAATPGATASTAPAAAEYAGPEMAIGSDENLKTNIRVAEKPLDEFLVQLGAHQYEYKDKQDGDKTYVSPMPQDLKKSTIGKSGVIDTPRGKFVDYARYMGASLSALSIHHQDIKDIKSDMQYLKNVIKGRKK